MSAMSTSSRRRPSCFSFAICTRRIASGNSQFTATDADSQPRSRGVRARHGGGSGREGVTFPREFPSKMWFHEGGPWPRAQRTHAPPRTPRVTHKHKLRASARQGGRTRATFAGDRGQAQKLGQSAAHIECHIRSGQARTVVFLLVSRCCRCARGRQASHGRRRRSARRGQRHRGRRNERRRRQRHGTPRRARAPGGQPSKLSRRHEASQAWRTPGGVRTARASQPRAPRVNPNRAHPPTHHGAAWHATRRSSGCGRHARRFPPPHLGGWLPGSEHGARRTPT